MIGSRSEACSPGSAVSISASNEPGCASRGSASPIRSAGESSRDTGRASRATSTRADSAASASSRSTFSPAASPVRTSASPGPSTADSADDAPVYGESSLGSLGSYDRATSSLRTSQLSLFGDSTECLSILPRSGSMRSGTVCQRRPSAPRTAGIDSGLWPTPTARDYKGTNPNQRDGGPDLPTALGG